MSWFELGLLVFFVFLLWGGYLNVKERRSRLAAMSHEERTRFLENERLTGQHGPLNPAMICPHCGAKGYVRTKIVDRKKGISGGKATAAVLTGGVSLVATGLSRKEKATIARCGSCSNTWSF